MKIFFFCILAVSLAVALVAPAPEAEAEAKADPQYQYHFSEDFEDFYSTLDAYPVVFGDEPAFEARNKWLNWFCKMPSNRVKRFCKIVLG